mmetsp:Transcript_36605/g.71976  ORF Transcript_36605/g.71976 Transcript_36605/m.71976 type:complete len:119 (-) Transcript_36605:87-443(-)
MQPVTVMTRNNFNSSTCHDPLSPPPSHHCRSHFHTEVRTITPESSDKKSRGGDENEKKLSFGLLEFNCDGGFLNLMQKTEKTAKEPTRRQNKKNHQTSRDAKIAQCMGGIACSHGRSR